MTKSEMLFLVQFIPWVALFGLWVILASLGVLLVGIPLTILAAFCKLVLGGLGWLAAAFLVLLMRLRPDVPAEKPQDPTATAPVTP